MGDVFAIVSKAVFEKEADVSVGDVWPVAAYTGSNKVFENTLADGGRIFMVTVRPPDEQLWLVAVLESPKFDAKKKAWVAKPNVVAVTDLTSLRPTIKFASGKGMSQDEGTLGMSLQTPRALGEGDADAIFAVIGGGGGGKGKSKAKPEQPVAKAAAPAKPAKKSTRSTDRISALLQAIRAAPDDEANREVLADTYEAAGDVDRARFIRTQVARAKLPRWDARAVVMELDERAILAEHEEAWRAELPAWKGVRYETPERGLFAWLAFDDVALVPKHIEAAMAACPITGLQLRWPRRGARPKLGAIEGLRSLEVSGTLLQAADLKWLATSPILSTIENLTLHNSRLDDDALKILLDSPHLGKLRRLQLPYNQIGNDGIAHLAEAELPQLVELGLAVETMDNMGSGGRDGTGINSEGVIALCNWDQMAKLEWLDLTGSQIGEDGLTAILTSKTTKRLKTLRIRSVSDFDFDEGDDRPDVLVAFKHAKGDRSFDELDIGENELSAGAATSLKTSPVLDKLKIFTCDFNSSDGDLAKLLDGAKWLDEVHILSLAETTLPVVKKVLARSPKALHTLNLSSSFPRSDLKGVATALAGAEMEALQSLDLHGCDVDDAGLKKLGGATKALPALLALRLGPNPDSSYSDDESPFSEDAAKAFVASPLGKQLKSVVVGIEALDRLPPPGIAGSDGDGDDDDEDEDDE